MMKKTFFPTPTQILVIGFLVVILIGSFLLEMPFAHEPGHQVSYIDALFTATSAVCVTGLVVVDTATTFNYIGEMIILLLIQIGGIGFVTFATLFTILLGRKVGIRERLLLSEAYNQTKLQGMVKLLLTVIYTTLFFETVGFLLLALRFVPDFGWEKGLYYSLFHSVSSFSNAGFDLFGDQKPFSSFTSYVNDPWVNLICSSLIIAGGLGFIVVWDLINYHRHKHLSLHTKIVLLASSLLLIGGTLVILIIEWTNPHTLAKLPFHGKWLSAYFQSVTTRSGGINTLDIAAMYPATLFFIVILMFIGAAPGSTGGGIKVTTWLTILLAAWSMTRDKRDVSIFRRRIPHDQVYKALTIMVMSIVLVVVVTMLITIFEHTSLMMALFEATSAFGTVGLSMGLTPHMTWMSKLLVITTMFAGRLGPLTLGFALAKRQTPPAFKYPEESTLIG
jgi:trk system potassium uptake protein TrkH